MTELSIARAEIDPHDFQGTIISAEPIGNPGEEKFYIVEEPYVRTRQNRVVSLLRAFRGAPYNRENKRLAVKWDVILFGGVDRGLRFPGLEEEINLRYQPKNDDIRGSEDSIAGIPRRLWMFPG